MKSWLTCTDRTIRLTLYIQPGARKTELAGEHGEALKIRLAAPPVDGKANQALIVWLAERFAVPRRDVTLLAGEKNRHKVVELAVCLNETAVLERLGL